MTHRHTISWEALEYFHQEKSTDWYWALGIITITSALVAILFGNILFALIILIFSFAAGVQAHRPPKRIRFELNHKGLVIDNILYPYTTLDSFCITDEHIHKPDPKLLVKSKKLLMPFIHVPVEGVDIEDVRTYLLQHIHEEEHQESILEKIMERFGF